jgi:hypothetical protein
MRTLQFLILLSLAINLGAQPLSSSFEIRYFTNDPKANRETDFKGETEWLNTEQRVSFLEKYAHFASVYFKNPELDKEIVTDKEIKDLLFELKAQPLTNVRKTIPLNGWKSYGYKNGEDNLKKKEIESWAQFPGTTISEGTLLLDNITINRKIDSLKWRFSVECKVKIISDNSCSLTFCNGKDPVLSISIKKGEISCISETKHVKNHIDKTEWTNLLIEADLTQKRFNLYANGTLLQYYIPMMKSTSSTITDFTIHSKGKTQLDNIFIFNHLLTGEVESPYISKVVVDENFEEKTNIDGWQKINFDDRLWTEVNLPAVHGGIREREEDFYLRKKIFVGDYKRATLVLETLDPGGEVWINNEVVAVIHDRHPYEFDISDYLKKNQDNLIAIRVKPYYAQLPISHTPTDRNIGWFLGRTTLVLSSKCMIKDAEIITKEVSKTVFQSHKINIQYNNPNFFEGSMEINYYPWFPEEGEKVATFSQEVKVRPRISNEYNIEFSIPSPKLWSSDSPNLYKVEFLLKDKDGKPVDDFVTTTGIRKIEQKNGDLLINGKPEMLNGAQIMGFRTPIETISKFNRCAPNETVAEEMLMIKKMGANFLRMHVHAESGICDGINDPRYAELADQMGIYMSWSTAAWIRAEEAWNLDFEGYPKYMKQVFNHPSIVIWEAANHPNRFKEHDISETNDYVKKIYQTISSVDQSRLISPTTFWQHTYYANYDGTKDFKGNSITPVPEYMADLVTRGSQDAYSGYGATWTDIRKAPNAWAASCLAAKDKAYFNFEHEESAAQPNWELSKGKPWYLLQSYEWEYDEGSIGRRLTTDEWRISQAWQAFSAWESMKKQVLLGYDGFSWCCLHGGANMGTYQKPLIDNSRHPKLAFYANKMIFQRTWAGSNNVDVVYGPEDKIAPVINHIGKEQKVNLVVTLENLKGNILDKKIFKNIDLQNGHEIKQIEGFRFKNVNNGIYAVVYEIFDTK